MNIFSRRKRLLNRTPKTPKMSSRRQFHRALRRHPAWPMVMEQAAARAKLPKEEAAAARAQARANSGRSNPFPSLSRWLGRLVRRNRPDILATKKATSRAKLRRSFRRNRILPATLLVVGGLVAVLNGVSGAGGIWFDRSLTDSQPPAGRFGAATAFDSIKREMLIFGGFVAQPGATPVADNTTWGFKPDIDKWFNRNPIHAPSPRGFASAAYDGARHNVVLFGGAPYRSTAVSGETWTWDGQDWTLQNPPEPRPDPRQNASMVYDAHRKVVVMFGGRGVAGGVQPQGSQGEALNDTWIWDGSTWKIMSSAGAPLPRHSAAMAYDVCRAEAVMFGGVGLAINNFAPQAGETWIWDGAKWTPGLVGGKSPILSPPRRVGASMVYSSRTGRVLLYGGLYTSDAGQPTVATDTDVWRWDGGSSVTGWEKLNSEISTLAWEPCGLLILCTFGALSRQPPARAYASFTMENDSGDLFGGTPSIVGSGPPVNNNSIPQVAFGDHFRFTSKFLVPEDEPAPIVGNTPLTRKCIDPVPIPPDEALPIGQDGKEAPKVEAREGMREIGRLPVLIGTAYPAANRNTHINPGSSNRTPNPNYTPPPDCPNRNELFGDRKDNVETGSNTHLATDPKRNRVYQFFICDPARGTTPPQGVNLPDVYKLLIGVYDGKTLKPLGSVLAPVRTSAYGQGLKFLDGLFHDVDRGRFLLRSYYHNGSTFVDELTVIQQDLIEKGVNPVVRQFFLTGGIAKMSFFNHPKTGRAKLLINRGGTSLSQLDIETNTVDWNATTTGCATMGDPHPDSIKNTTPMRSGNRVYNACSGTISGSNRMGVVRISIIENPDGSETAGTAEAFAGPFNVNANWIDPGAERMLVGTETFGGKALWVFDGKTSRFIGRAGLSSAPVGFGGGESGFDQDIGRFYYHIKDDQGWVGGEKFKVQGGLLMVDTRLTPVPQAFNFTQFSAIPGVPVATMASGPGLPRRVFIRRTAGAMNKHPDGETLKMSNEMHYTVLTDEVPIPEKLDITQLDALTIPVRESAGKTEVTFDAEGSSYGIRLRAVGGIWAALRPVAQAYPREGEVVDSVLLGNRYVLPGCFFPDRELIAGWVPQAHLSDLDASARSSGLDVDSNSKTDLEGPFSRCNPSANQSNFPPSAKPVFDVLWPLWQLAQLQGNNAVGTNLSWGKHFKETECVGDSNQANEAKLGDLTVNPAPLVPSGVTVPGGITNTVTAPTGGKVPIGGITASATCNQKGGSVQAISRGALGGSASSEAFSVGEGYSTVAVKRDPAKGIVVTSTAVATGIKLPEITIGYIKTEAVAWSNGRPGEKRASFTRTICRVTSPLFEHEKECLTEDEQKDMVTKWNSAWGINSKMILPAPDPELYKGSPGGYIAGVVKPVADELEDQLFARDYQREVPGLVIEFNKDSQAQGPSRQALQLAAVRAVTGFGVQCNAELVYSPQAKDCVALTFEDDPIEFEDEEVSSTDDTAFNTYDGDSVGWAPIEATGAPSGLALGQRVGRFIENLPVLRRLPIRQMGEALLAGSVWMLLGMPLFLASRRFALNLARRS